MAQNVLRRKRDALYSTVDPIILWHQKLFTYFLARPEFSRCIQNSLLF